MSWREIKLGDYITIKHGYAFKSKFFADSGKYVLLTPGNCYQQGGLRLKGEKEKYFVGDIPEDFVLKTGDLIVVMTDLVQSAPILGGAFFVPEEDKFLHNQRLGLVEVLDKGNLDKKFLYYLFNTEHYRSQVRGSATGATVRHTAPERIYRCRVKVPDINVQQHIADILSTYEDLIENNRRRIVLLEQAACLLYKEWFVHLRFPGHEHVKITDGIPEGWERLRVETIVQRIPAGRLFDQKSASPKGKIPILDQGRSGLIGYHNEEPSVEASLNDPIIVFANHTCYQRIIHYPFSSIQNVLPFKPHPARYRNIYWLHHATDGLVKLNAYKGHWPEFMAKETLFPPELLCSQFGDFVEQNHKMICWLERENDRLVEARNLLLPRLMNGEIAV